MLEGRTDEEKRRLMANVTDAVASTLGVQRERVRVIITEVPKKHWAVGGVPLSEIDEKNR